MAKLVFRELFMNPEYPLEKYSTTIGRMPQCDISIPNYERFKKLPTLLQREVAQRLVHVSRVHARITLKDGKYFIADVGTSGAGSTYGTFVNNMKLEYGRTCEIHHGDHLRFGPVECVFQEDAPPANPPNSRRRKRRRRNDRRLSAGVIETSAPLSRLTHSRRYRKRQGGFQHERRPVHDEGAGGAWKRTAHLPGAQPAGG